jgi:hypothetical protein
MLLNCILYVKEIARIDGQMAKTRVKTDRYFEAFENGTMKPDICSQKVKDLNATLEALGAEKRELEARRERLELPAIDREMLSRLVDKFEEVLAEGTNPQKKHLLRQMVKKVLIHDRRTIEIWYGLPNQASVCTPGHLAPRVGLEPTDSPPSRLRSLRWFYIRKRRRTVRFSYGRYPKTGETSEN